MKKILYQILLLIFLLILFVTSGCNKNSTSPTTSSTTPQEEKGSWNVYSPYDWTHDGEPYHAKYCIVYSDGASYQTKEEVGLFVDGKFTQILNLFNFQDMDDLRYPPGYDKVDVYINRYHERSFAAAYWGSVFITIRSEDVNINNYDYLFRHELTHVFQFLIEGKVNLSTEVWFTEGIAIYGGGGLGGVTDIEDLVQWINSNSTVPNQGNPVCIQVWDDFPPDADIAGYYSTVFDLAMRYFLDPIGLNKSIGDVLGLFYDLRNDIAFPTAFQSNFSLDLETLESEYYDRMRTYLSNN